MSFELEGLDDFISFFDEATKKAPQEIEKFKNNMSNIIMKDVVENTPVNKDPKIVGGTLRRSWKRRDVGNDIEIYNDARSKDGEYYAWDVEYGYRTRAGMHLSSSKRRKKGISKGGKILFVPGKFMLRNAFKLASDVIPEEGKKVLDRIFGE